MGRPCNLCAPFLLSSLHGCLAQSGTVATAISAPCLTSMSIPGRHSITLRRGDDRTGFTTRGVLYSMTRTHICQSLSLCLILCLLLTAEQRYSFIGSSSTFAQFSPTPMHLFSPYSPAP